jgi:hypothetical protein
MWSGLQLWESETEVRVRVWGGDDVLFVHGILVRMDVFVLDIGSCIMGCR